jgi:hypothetical protein
MADKRISQLVERTDIANNDVVPIVASGATTTNKATISSIQEFMQENLDLGVTSVGITLGTIGNDVSVSGSPITTSGNITINIPSASSTARGLVNTIAQTFSGEKTFANGLSLLPAGGTNQVTRFLNIGTIHEGTAGLNQIGFNNSNNIYFGKGLSDGGVLTWSNSEVRSYTLPNVSGIIALTTNLTDFVTLSTVQTITAQKTFTTSGSSDTMIISHGSGSGFALDVIKAGNGEAIRVTKTSGSGNAMTVIGGNFEAPTIVRTGGTSSQFLKADGSVDSSTYLTTSTAASTYITIATPTTITGVKTFDTGTLILAAAGTANSTHLRNSSGDGTSVSGSNVFGFNSSNNIYVRTQSKGGFIFNFNNGAANRTYTLPDATGTISLTSDLGAYLPLTGGTLTGGLNGTSASFSSDVQTSTRLIAAKPEGEIRITPDLSGTSNSIQSIGSLPFSLSSADAIRLSAGGSINPQITLATTGAVTLTGALNGTSASFSVDDLNTLLVTNPTTTGATTGSGLGFRAFNGTSVTQSAGIILTSSTWSFGTYLANQLSIGSDGTGGLALRSANAAPIRFYTGGTTAGLSTQRLEIASTGEATFSSSVKMGNASLASIATNSTGADVIVGSGTNSSPAFQVWDDNSLSVPRFIVTREGSVGIGTAGPTAYTGYSTLALNGSNGGLLEFKKGDVQQAYITNAGDPLLQFVTNGNEQVRITSDRYIRMSSGTGGIQFNGDTAAANALDDYEEGTWTPTLVTGGTINSTTTITGVYCKVGQIVTLRFYVIGNMTSDGTEVSIGGIPFDYPATSLGRSWIVGGTVAGTLFANAEDVAYINATTDRIGRKNGNSVAASTATRAFEGFITYMTNV